MGGRKNATIAAAVTGMAALAIVPTWTDAARQSHHDGGHHKRVARNVIVLQGDGMATAQRDLIRLVTVGNKEGQDLEMNRLEHTGLVHTDPADPEEAVTDSAAAATAFSTGYKSFNGAIGVDAEGNPRPHAARGRAPRGQGDRPRHDLAGHRRDARGLRGARQRPRGAERDRAPVPGGRLQARRDPRRRRGLLVPAGHARRPARPPRRPTRPRRARATAATSSSARSSSATTTSPRARGWPKPAGASCSACSPTRRCSSTARRATATSTTRSCRSPRWRARRSTSSPATATGCSC